MVLVVVVSEKFEHPLGAVHGGKAGNDDTIFEGGTDELDQVTEFHLGGGNGVLWLVDVMAGLGTRDDPVGHSEPFLLPDIAGAAGDGVGMTGEALVEDTTVSLTVPVLLEVGSPFWGSFDVLVDMLLLCGLVHDRMLLSSENRFTSLNGFGPVKFGLFGGSVPSGGALASGSCCLMGGSLRIDIAHGVSRL